MSQRLRIFNIVGARPNLPKIAPLLREMQRYPEIEPVLVHTGQHYDERLSDIFFHQLGIPAPDINLDVGSASHAAQTAEILKRIEPHLMKQKPDIVLVVGDVNSTIAVSLAAAKLSIRVAHVEAGLRSFDRTMPEEINRILTDALSDYLFVTERDAVGNLLREGRPREAIHFVGNIMIDSLRLFQPIAENSRIGRDLDLQVGTTWCRFAVLTLHRPSNVDSSDKLVRLLEAIGSIAKDLPIIFPVHPRTHHKLKEQGLTLRHPIQIIPPLGYIDFIRLLSKATLVFTDSGGIQEETTALGVPCLTLRENTERPVTVHQGTNFLVGTDPDKVIAAANSVLAGERKTGQIPELWDGHTAERIVDILVHRSSS